MNVLNLTKIIDIESKEEKIENFETGSWRIERPIWNEKTCINCLFCWQYCPDASIILDKNEKMVGIDYHHCKGCGICVEVCPTKPKSLVMVLEKDVQEQGLEATKAKFFNI